MKFPQWILIALVLTLCGTLVFAQGFGIPSPMPEYDGEDQQAPKEGFGFESGLGFGGPNFAGLDSKNYIETKIGAAILRASSKNRKDFKEMCLSDQVEELTNRIMDSYQENSQKITDLCTREQQNAQNCDAEKICSAFSNHEIPFPPDVKKAAQEAGITLSFPMTYDQVVSICKLMASKEVGREMEYQKKQWTKEIQRFRENCQREKEFEQRREQEDAQRRAYEDQRRQEWENQRWENPNQNQQSCGDGMRPDGQGGCVRSTYEPPPQEQSPQDQQQSQEPTGDSGQPPASDSGSNDSGSTPSDSSGDDSSTVTAVGVIQNVLNSIPNSISGFFSLGLQAQEPFDSNMKREDYNMRQSYPTADQRNGEYNPNPMGPPQGYNQGYDNGPQGPPMNDPYKSQPYGGEPGPNRGSQGGPGFGPMDCEASDEELLKKMSEMGQNMGPSDEMVTSMCSLEAQKRTEEMERVASEMEYRQEECALNYADYCDFKKEVATQCIEMSSAENVKKLVTEFVQNRCKMITLKENRRQDTRGLLKSALELYNQSEYQQSDTFGNGFEAAAYELSKKQDELDAAKKKVGVMEVIAGDSGHAEEINRINNDLDKKIIALEALQKELPDSSQENIEQIISELKKEKEKLAQRAQAYENPMNILGRLSNSITGGE